MCHIHLGSEALYHIQLGSEALCQIQLGSETLCQIQVHVHVLHAMDCNGVASLHAMDCNGVACLQLYLPAAETRGPTILTLPAGSLPNGHTCLHACR